MKKIYPLALFLVISSIMFAKENVMYDLDYEVPGLPSKNSYLVDLKQYKNQSITNARIEYYANERTEIRFYGNNPTDYKWEEIGKSEIKGFSDKDSESFKNKDCKNWRYFVLDADSSSLIYKTSVSGKTLKVEVREKGDNFDQDPLPKFTEGKAEVFNIEVYDAEDYLVIHNLTNIKNIKCVPYYFDYEDCDWKRAFEIANLIDYNDTCKIEVIDDDGVEDLEILAFEIIPEGNYKFKLYEKNNDLWVDVIE